MQRYNGDLKKQKKITLVEAHENTFNLGFKKKILICPYF